MKIVSVTNYKGGVGKTTITANLAVGLAQRGKKVLVIDVDPQTNLTFSFLKVDEWQKNFEKNKTIKIWFDAIIDDQTPPPLSSLIIQRSGIDIISSHLRLIDMDIDLALKLTAASPRQHKNNFIKTYSYFRNALQDFNDYDVVLFDCPPNMHAVTRNAIIASDYYIIPAKMDYLSTLGIDHLQHGIREFISDYNSYTKNKVFPKFLGVVATMISLNQGEPIAANKTYISELKIKNITMFDTMIRENKTLFSFPVEFGKQVIEQSHKSGSYSKVVDELHDFVDEFMQRTNLGG
ncbi:MAG: AAA family ATPase [Firmicutes bacterium]|nr:AAA family ATPase [Bacillota bacterium]